MPGIPHTLRGIVLGAAALLLAGCVEITELVRVRADGSGEIVQTIQLSPEFVAGMKESGAKVQGTGDAGWREQLDRATAQARTDPAAFGEGVTFVSAEPIGTDEAPGVRLTLAFTDIEHLDLSRVQALGAEAPAAAASDGELRFRFERRSRGRRVLTAVFTEPPAAANPAPVPKVGPKDAGLGGDALGKRLTEMVTAMFRGLRIAFAVEVPALVSTNSPYVTGNTVTLLEIDMDALLADPTRLADLGAADASSLAALRQLFADVPGVKLPPADEVRIEFRD